MRELTFYSLMLVVPVLFFVLQYFIINGNSILLAFEKTNNGVTTFAGFENFKMFFENFKNDPNYNDMLIRSLYVYLLTTALNTFFPILLSYYIYKEMVGYRLFKVLLFMPTILSSIITVSIYRMLANEVIPEIWYRLTDTRIHPLLSNPNTTFNAILFYSVWTGLGGGLLTQLAAMNTVNVSVKEAAHLEGIGFLQELWHIVLPACYQVIMLGFVPGVASVFTNSLNLYAFYGGRAPVTTNVLGYFLQVRTLQAEFPEYHYLSAFGLICTLIAVPVTLLLQFLVNKFGPTEENREKKIAAKQI